MDVPTAPIYTSNDTREPVNHQHDIGKRSITSNERGRFSPADAPAHPMATAWMAGLQGFLLFALLMVLIIELAHSGGHAVPRSLGNIIAALPILLEVTVIAIAVFLVTQKGRVDRMNGWGVLALHGIVVCLVIGAVTAAHLGSPATALTRLAKSSSGAIKMPAGSAVMKFPAGSNKEYLNTRWLAQRVGHFWHDLVKRPVKG